jgi:hypothetical protein
MFSRGDVFSDPNEGVDALLAQLEIAKPDSGCGMGWSDRESARTHHDALKRSYLVSCWSRTPESVAMWSLYSQDLSSIRIRTSETKLLDVAESLLNKYCVSRLSTDDLGKKAVAAAFGRVGRVTYRPLHEIAQKVARRAQSRSRLAARHTRLGKPVLPWPEIGDRYWERERARSLKELSSMFALKDESFAHEDEVRVAVRLGEVICDPNTLKSAAHRDPTHQYHAIFKRDMGAWPTVGRDSVPARAVVKCPDGFVEGVALDPRCPPHKASFIRKWFESRGVVIEQSRCFGYVPSSFKVFPEW